MTALLLLALAGCEKPMPPAQQKLLDDRAVAQVEAMNHAPPPLRPVTAQALPVAFVARHATGANACAFVPKGKAAAVALILVGRAEMQFDGQPAIFASDSGSEKLPLGPWSRYLGKALSVKIEQPGAGSPIARLVVSDPYNRQVYESAGTLRCPA